MNEIELKKLWTALQGNYDVGTFDEFKSNMDTPDKRRRFYNVITNVEHFDVGPYNVFEKRLAGNTTPPPTIKNNPPVTNQQDDDEPIDPILNHSQIPTPRPQVKLTPVNLTPQDVLNGKFVEFGMVGNIVGQIQQLLIKNGYKNISKTGQPDNKFGSRTLASVKKFQHDKGIGMDGVVGPMTWDKLNGLPTSSGLKLSNLVPQDNDVQTSYDSPNYTGGELGDAIK